MQKQFKLAILHLQRSLAAPIRQHQILADSELKRLAREALKLIKENTSKEKVLASFY